MWQKILIVLAFVLAIGSMLGWAFEAPYVEGTRNADDLLFKAATWGYLAGALLGFGLAFKAKSFIGRFQVIAVSILILTAVATLLAHYLNRSLGDQQQDTVYLPVKQVTGNWRGRGLSRDDLADPDGYFIYFESTEGESLRLYHAGSEPPDVGPSRMLPVLHNPGFFGYPRYQLPEDLSMPSGDEWQEIEPADL